MYYRLKKKMKGFTYGRFISYLGRRCDVITFNIPYFSWHVGKAKPEKFDEETTEYLEDVEEFLEELKPYIIDDYVSNEYFEEKCSHMMRIIVAKLTEDSYHMFSAGNDIFDWRFPVDVEDLCFFTEGRCFLYTIAHEEIFELIEPHDLELPIFKKIGLKLEPVDLPSRDIRLHYTLTY